MKKEHITKRLLKIIMLSICGLFFGFISGQNHIVKAGTPTADDINTLFTSEWFNYGTSCPKDFCTDSSDNIYILDQDNNLAKYNSSGIKQWKYQVAPGNVIFGICLDNAGNIYVCNNNSNTIYKYNNSGTCISKYQDDGMGGPDGLTIDKSTGYLYVVNWRGVHIINSDSMTYVSKKTISSSDLSSPNLICMDSEGNFYIGDKFSGKIVKYDKNFNKKSEFHNTSYISRMTNLLCAGSILYVAAENPNNTLVKLAAADLSYIYKWDIACIKSVALSKDNKLIVNTTNDYTNYVFVKSKIASANNSLSSLSVEGYDFTSAFNSGTTEYTLNLPATVTKINITPTLADTTASMTLNGYTIDSAVKKEVSLKMGENTITLAITAENKAVKNYTIHANVIASNINSLSSLSVEGYTFTEEFSSGTNEYTLNLPSTVTSIKFTPTLADTKAYMDMDGIPLKSAAQQEVLLGFGENNIILKITAENKAVKYYTIHVNVEVPPDCTLIRYSEEGGYFFYDDGDDKTSNDYYNSDLYVGDRGESALRFNLPDITDTILSASLNVAVKSSWSCYETGKFEKLIYNLYGSNKDTWVCGDPMPPKDVTITEGVEDSRKTDYWKSFDVKSFVMDNYSSDKKCSFVIASPILGSYVYLYNDKTNSLPLCPYLLIRTPAIDKQKDTFNNLAPKDITFNISVADTLKSIVSGGYTLINGTDYTISGTGTAVTIKKEYLEALPVGNNNFTINLSKCSPQLLNIVASDTTAPGYDIVPAASNISINSCDLSVDINEAGTIYYIVVPDEAAEPTSAQVKAGVSYSDINIAAHGVNTVSTSPFSHTFNITGLKAGKAYDIYVAAEDDEATPNMTAKATKIDITTAVDATSTITAGTAVTEPVKIPSTATTDSKAVKVFDFVIKDAGTSDELSTDITQVTLNTSGTGKFNKLNWILNGPDVSNATGTYDSETNTIMFSGLNISVADKTSETYIVSAYYKDNTGLTEGQTYRLSLNGSSATNFTVADSGSTMAAGQSNINNETGSAVDITATKLIFTTQPSYSISGISMTQPVVKAVDEKGNVDTDYTGSISLSEASSGSLAGKSAVSAVAGVATFDGLVYTALADQETFTLTALGGALTNGVSDPVTSDVIATKLIFSVQPSPVSIFSGITESFDTVPVVKTVDKNGTVDTGYSANILLSIADPEGGSVDGTVGSLSCTAGDTDGSGTTITLSPINGIATFTGLSLKYTNHGVSDSLVLKAVSGMLAPVNSDTITSKSAPGIISVTLPAARSYKTEEKLDFKVVFNQLINITDNDGKNKPYLSITLAVGGEVRAYYQSGSGTDTLTFRYTVSEGNEDTDGIAILPAINLNDAGTIKNASGADAVLTFTEPDTSKIFVDGIVPEAPVVTSITQDTGLNGSDGLTKDQNLIINGTAEKNSTVSVYLDSVLIGTASASGTGSWSYDYTGTAITEGNHAFTAKAADAAGNKGGLSAAFNITIDITNPASPSIISITEDSGILSDDKITKDTTLIFSGKADADCYVELYNADTHALLGSCQANGAGNWSLDCGSPFTMGTYQVEAVAKDAAYNQSASSAVFTFTVDTEAPTKGSISINAGAASTAGTNVTLTLSAIGASKMMVSEDSSFEGVPYEAYAINKSFTLSAGDGTKVIYVKYQDAAGNIADTVSDTIILDAEAPSAAITSISSGSTSLAAIPVKIIFSENVADFDEKDLTIGNGTALNFQGSDSVYTVDILPKKDGTVTVDVKGGCAHDNAGNANTAADQFSISSDRTAPALSGTDSSNVTYTGASVIAGINEEGTIYYIAVPEGSTAPSAAEIKAGGNYDGVIIVAAGSQAVSTSPYSHTFNVTGLQPGKAYDIYIVAEDDEAVPNIIGTPTKIEITTPNIPITAFDHIDTIQAGNAKSALYADAEAVKKALPASVTANGKTVTVDVSSWEDIDTYNPSIAGSYTFRAVLKALPAGYENSDNKTVQVEVVLTNKTFTVKYYANGGDGAVPADNGQYIEGAEATLKEGSSLSKLHYSFAGWSLSPSASAVTGPAIIIKNENVDLYAVWTENQKYSVKYDANGGDGTVPEDSNLYYAGDTVVPVVSGGAISLSNHTFEGWSTAVSGGAILTYTMKDSDVTFYAVWVEDGKYIVTYDANGGGTAPADENQYYQGQTAVLLSGNGLKRLHYNFTGWALSKSGSAVTDAAIKIESNNITLYALWAEKNKYTVSYDRNDGIGSVPPDALYYEDDLITPTGASELTKANASFGGWSLTPQGSAISEAFTLGSSNITLYAVWISDPAPTPISTPTSLPAQEETTKEVRQINVNAVNGTTTSTVAKVEIVRETAKEKKVDTVILDNKKTEEVIQKVIEQKQDIVQIVMDDIPENKADEVKVTINKDAVKALSDNKVVVEVKTEEVSIQVSKESLKGISETEEDLYFHVVPIRDEAKQKEAIDNAITAGVVQEVSGGNEVVALGTPMTIETNYQGFLTNVTFSLKGINIPKEEAARTAFLSTLGVYINHSDGEQEFSRGKIKYDADGNPVGIEIEISKFSSFTIVSIKNMAPVAADLKIRGKAVAGNKLTASYIYRDPDKDEQGDSIIAWYRADHKNGRNKKLIRKGSSLTYQVTGKDQGKYIIIEVTPIAKTGERKGQTVSAYVKTASVKEAPETPDNKAPKAVSVKLKGKTIVGSKLTVSYTYKDAEQDKEGTTTIQWYRSNGADGAGKQKINGANSFSYTITEADTGKYILAEIRPYAKTGSKEGVKVARNTQSFVAEPELIYTTHVKLGLNGSKSYAEKVIKLLKQNYKSMRVEMKKEGKYYRVYIDFINKAAAQAACNDMKEKRYIDNYFFYSE